MKRHLFRTIFLLGLASVTSLFFLNCGAGQLSGAGAIENSIPKSSIHEELRFSSFRFFYGGWYPRPGTPNWSDDMTFVFKSNSITVDSKTTDELCIKPTYTLEDEDRVILLNFIKDLKVVVAKDIVPLPDAGSKTIVFKMIDGTESTVYLKEAGARNGDNLATNGAEIADFLQNLNKKIPIACQ